MNFHKNQVINIIYAFTFLLLLSSCFRDEHHKFTDKELDFVSYGKNQMLKFRDTLGIIQTLTQSDYIREFRKSKEIGLGDDYHEFYHVYYTSDDGYPIFNEYVENEDSQLNINFLNYSVRHRIEPMKYAQSPPTLIIEYPSISIEGKEYQNVYVITVNEDYGTISQGKEATLYWNREYGAIQLKFPNGKAIVRVE